MKSIARAPVVFPALAQARWAEVDLDRMSRLEPRATGKNPLLDHATCDAFVRTVASRLGADFTYGGYGEDRAHLWAGHYMAGGRTVHLGIDLNVPAGTSVAAPASCRVARVHRDPDQGGGWGGYVVLALDEAHHGCLHVVLGHLAHAGLPELGAKLARGGIIGEVGQPRENGNWFPHLHVQCFDAGMEKAYAPAYELMDGYGAREDLARHPDPTGLIMA